MFPRNAVSRSKGRILRCGKRGPKLLGFGGVNSRGVILGAGLKNHSLRRNMLGMPITCGGPTGALCCTMGKNGLVTLGLVASLSRNVGGGPFSLNVGSKRRPVGLIFGSSYLCVFSPKGRFACVSSRSNILKSKSVSTITCSNDGIRAMLAGAGTTFSSPFCKFVRKSGLCFSSEGGKVAEIGGASEGVTLSHGSSHFNCFIRGRQLLCCGTKCRCKTVGTYVTGLDSNA